MRQDRRLNGWILIASILGIVLGFALIVGGAGLATIGFLKPEKLVKIDELNFFILQEGITKAQLKLFNGILKSEILYLFLGIIVAVVGLTALIFAIISLVYAKKHKVVRRRVALLFFTLIPLAIAGSAATYLILEFESFKPLKTDLTFIKNIKYICYGIVGAFGLVSIFNLLGLMFGRSEKFMSNDNGKYAFNNNSLRERRANVNNNTKGAPVAPAQSEAPMSQQPAQPARQGNPSTQGQAVRVAQGQPMRQGQPARPMPPRPGQPVRPAQPNINATRSASGARPAQPARPMQAPRPQMNASAQSTARPVASRNASVTARPMPQRPNTTKPTASGKVCPVCGKVLTPGEKYCTICGHKISD